jgi:two-component system, sensor histidine kinase and response regulator
MTEEIQIHKTEKPPEIPVILVVDDEPDVLELFNQTFWHSVRNNELEILFAGDGQEALEMIERRPDTSVVFTDINMPHMDGLTLLSHLDGVNLNMKAVVISAYGDMRNIRTAMNRGAFDFVTKPIDIDDLENTVNKTILEVDRTRRMLQERDQAIASAQAKSDFVAMVSHEIRTPIIGVLSMAQFLLEEELQPNLREYAENIVFSGEALLSVINDILDVSKIEAGKLDLEIVDFDLKDLIEGIGNLFASSAVERGLELVTFVDPDLPAHLRGDPERVRQIITNLVGNAVKFTKEGVITVRAIIDDTKVSDRVSDSIPVRIEVKDTGIGLEPNKQQEIFEAFTQAEASTMREFGGTGLGLSICRRLTEIMGGEIGVESTLGAGATFWFSLPLNRCAERDGAPNYDLSGVTVSVVSDQEVVWNTARRYLESTGATVEVISGDGVTALNDTSDPDVVLIDQAALADRNLVDVEFYAGAPPVLLMAYQESGILHQGNSDTQIRGEIRKPIRYEDLVRAVAVAAGGSSVTSAQFNEHRPSIREFISPDVEEARKQGCLILVVEDNPTSRVIIRRHLNRLGYVFEMVDNGAQALQLALDREYGLILTDCHMPELDGFGLARGIREAEAGGDVRLPIVAISADTLPGTAERCFESGMDDYMIKPVGLTDLDEMILRWLPRAAELRRELSGDPNPPQDDSKNVTDKTCDFDRDLGHVVHNMARDVLDIAAIREQYGEIDDEVRDMFRVFIETTKPSIDRLSAALDSSLVLEAAEMAHQVKGAADHAAAGELVTIFQDIELSLNNARSRASEIGIAWERAETAMQRLFGIDG